MPSQQPKYPMHLPPKKVGGVAKSRAKASPNARRKPRPLVAPAMIVTTSLHVMLIMIGPDPDGPHRGSDWGGNRGWSWC